MSYLMVSNWSKWQTYRKDRGTPPWIKIHRNLTTNVEWNSLSDSEKGQLVSIWLIAADRDGQIPSDPRLLRKIALLDEEPNINKFIELGFIDAINDLVGCHDDAKVTSERRRSDAPETETETERDGQNDFDRLWDLYAKKTKKKPAESAFRNLSQKDRLSLIDHIPDRVARDETFANGYQPDLVTFINQRRWEDEDWKRLPKALVRTWDQVEEEVIV